jgi:hypothetical protein
MLAIVSRLARTSALVAILGTALVLSVSSCKKGQSSEGPKGNPEMKAKMQGQIEAEGAKARGDMGTKQPSK